MKSVKRLLLCLAILAVIAAGGGIAFIQTQYAGIGLPWVSSVDLPELPKLPPAQTQLQADQSGDIFFPTRSPYDFSELLHNYDNSLKHTGKGHLVLPDSASADKPVPAMIILHGSGGIDKDREMVYAKLFAAHGIAGFVLDYYSVRGVTSDHSYLMKTLSASETDILVDAYSALKVLGSHPAIDAERIGVTGYSYGGMATRYLLDSRIKEMLAPETPGFAAHIDVYGPCHQTLGNPQTTGAPYLAIFGDEDYSVDVATCDKVHAEIAQYGEMERLLIPGAGHAWESSRERKLRDYPYISDCSFQFDSASGKPMVNGKATSSLDSGATREEMAFARANIMIDAPQCIKNGYIIGSDKNADTQAKAKMLEFLGKHFFSAPSDS